MKRGRPVTALQLALVVGISAGCASSVLPPSRSAPAADEPSSTQPAQPQGLNLSGFPVAFREGYAAGCESGRAGERRRDAARYKADTNYMTGWNDGYSICAGRK